MRKIRPHFTYANVMVTILAVAVFGGGSALAAAQLGKNSIGSRQLKAKSVTTGKIALNAVNGSRVANGSLTGQDINLSKLGTVPSAASAGQAGNSSTVGGHGASCPAGTSLVDGICYDSSSNPPVASVFQAADNCAAKGGYLPSPLQLYSVRNVINLGTGIGADHQYTDVYYGNTGGGSYRTVVVDGSGSITETEVSGTPSGYICAYSLVR